MRIAQTTDGRFVKILSPEMQGLIGRLYQEVRERKDQGVLFDAALDSFQNELSIIDSQIDTMVVRYNEVMNILRKLFPENENIARIDRPLEVSGSVKADRFIATSVAMPGLEVANQLLITNLNAEFVGGKKYTDIEYTIGQKVLELENTIKDLLAQRDIDDAEKFAPASHVGSGGTGVHAYANYTDAGFMSPTDKRKIDDLKIPGFTISATPPATPKASHIWIDVN